MSKARSSAPPTNIIQIKDVHALPMPEIHKQMVIRHIKRLENVLSNADERSDYQAGQNFAARECLARMTLVLNKIREAKDGVYEEESESLAADFIDGCILSALTQVHEDCEAVCREVTEVSQRGNLGDDDGKTSSVRPRPRTQHPPPGRRHEFATLMQELEAEDADPVLELEDAPERSRTVVPDQKKFEDVGTGIDWFTLFGRRSRSESRASPYAQLCVIRDREKHTRKLARPNRKAAVSAWPLTAMDGKQHTGRARSGTDSSDVSDWSWSEFLSPGNAASNVEYPD